MKKLLALALCICMVLTLCACAGKAPETPAVPEASDTSAEKSVETQPKEKRDPVKIGVIFYSKDDALGRLVYSYLNYAAEVVENLEIQWAIGSFSADAQLADAENLISAGVDGIMALTLDDVAMTQIAKTCNDNEVYFQVMFRKPASEETAAVLKTFPYYVGYAIEDTVATAAQTIDILAGKGIKNIAVGGNSHSATSLLRMEGMQQGVQKNGTTIISEFDIGNDISSIQSDVQNILDTYKDVEAIWSMSGTNGIADIIINTLRAHKDATGKTIGLMTFDSFEGMAQALNDGFLYGAVSGQAPLCLQAFAALYNAIDGTPLSDAKVELYFPYLIIASPEDLDFMEQYYNNPEIQLYDEEIIKSMLVRYTPDVKMEALNEFWASFSMDWIKQEIASRG